MMRGGYATYQIFKVIVDLFEQQEIQTYARAAGTSSNGLHRFILSHDGKHLARLTGRRRQVIATVEETLQRHGPALIRLIQDITESGPVGCAAAPSPEEPVCEP